MRVCVSQCGDCQTRCLGRMEIFATAKHYRKVPGLFHLCCKLGLWVLQYGTKYTLGKTRLRFHFLHCRENPKLACSDTAVLLCCQGQCTNSIQWLFEQHWKTGSCVRGRLHQSRMKEVACARAHTQCIMRHHCQSCFKYTGKQHTKTHGRDLLFGISSEMTVGVAPPGIRLLR